MCDVRYSYHTRGSWLQLQYISYAPVNRTKQKERTREKKEIRREKKERKKKAKKRIKDKGKLLLLKEEGTAKSRHWTRESGRPYARYLCYMGRHAS